MAIKDCEIDGYLIPKCATQFVNIWAIGRDPVSWPNDPLEFNPDRFGPGSLHENVDVKGNDFELIPFGAGRRICAGMNLGLRMVPLVTAALAHSFDWKLLDGQIADMTADQHRRLPLPPGPKGWPLLGNLFQLGSNPTHRTLQTLSRSHGCDGLLHLRFGIVDVIVLSTASAVAKCFCNHDVNLSSRPLDSTGKLMAYNAQDLILAPYGRRWRMMRKICSSHLFSNKALNEFQDVRHGEVVRLVREFAGRKAVVNVGEMVSICAINALSLVLVGRRISAGYEEALQFKEMAIELTRLAGQPNIGDFLPWIDWLDLQASD
ncbi:hypothetical protein KFK09_005909 [Dendrobium nobile]|uniref:Uncharacterized protein n=1 Tax=Dendrobium nobile TaxID=94219 RepID=A0A8T3BX20_DENNO|nr:hypothetical protein KFK09_005909 [Dendrobium nobile]